MMSRKLMVALLVTSDDGWSSVRLFLSEPKRVSCSALTPRMGMRDTLRLDTILAGTDNSVYQLGWKFYSARV